MKYKIFYHRDNSFDIITEDGCVAAFFHNEENFVTQYYQTRLTECNAANYLWDELSQGKSYIKDWDGDPEKDEVIKDALDWLVSPTPEEGWELDQTIWSEFFRS